jgi:hypothetical protein
MGVFVSGGRSNEEVSNEIIATETRMRAIEKENVRQLVALEKRDSELGAAARRDYDVIMASALVSGTRLEALLRGEKIIARYEANGAALLNEQRQRRVDEQQREIAMHAAVEEERAAAHVRSHPLGPTEIVKMVESRGVVLRLGDNAIEVAPVGVLDRVTKAYLRTSAKSVAQLIEARSHFEVIAKVPRDDEESD